MNGKNGKQRIGLLAIMLLTLLFFSACGSGSKEKEIEGPVAESFHQIMDVEKSAYYLESKVTEEFLEQGEAVDPMTSVSAEAVDGDKAAYLFGADQLTEKQIVLGEDYYNMNKETKTYYVSGNMDDVPMPEFDQYIRSAEVEHEGKTYRYDQYEDEMTIESYNEGETEPIDEVFIYVKKYFVDENGELAAIVYENRDHGGEEAFYRRVDQITKFRAGSVPKGIFEIPKDYKEIKEGEDDPMIES